MEKKKINQDKKDSLLKTKNIDEKINDEEEEGKKVEEKVVEVEQYKNKEQQQQHTLSITNIHSTNLSLSNIQTISSTLDINESNLNTHFLSSFVHPVILRSSDYWKPNYRQSRNITSTPLSPPCKKEFPRATFTKYNECIIRDSSQGVPKRLGIFSQHERDGEVAIQKSNFILFKEVIEDIFKNKIDNYKSMVMTDALPRANLAKDILDDIQTFNAKKTLRIAKYPQKSDGWLKERTLLSSTASNIYKIKHCAQEYGENETDEALKERRIAYLDEKFSKNLPEEPNLLMEYGSKMEIPMLDRFLCYYTNQSDLYDAGDRVLKVNLLVDKNYPWLGASADFVILHANHELSIVEVKCPNFMKPVVMDTHPYASMKKSVKPYTPEKYMLQLQCIAGVFNSYDYSIRDLFFVVGTKNKTFITLHEYDKDMYKNIVKEARIFHNDCFVPELKLKIDEILEKKYPKDTTMNTDNTSTGNKSSTSIVLDNPPFSGTKTSK